MKVLCAVLACFAAFFLTAADEVRIDLQADSDLACNTVSEGVTGSPARWQKEHPRHRLVISAPAEPEWKAYTVVFTPEHDGTIQFIVMGNRRDQEIRYDKITLKGAVLKNGDFEEIGSRGVPAGWSLQPEALCSDGAVSGKYCVQTNHDRRVQQAIRVKGGVPLELTFFARKAPKR